MADNVFADASGKDDHKMNPVITETEVKDTRFRLFLLKNK